MPSAICLGGLALPPPTPALSPSFKDMEALVSSYSDAFNPQTPTPRGYEKAFEKGRDGEGVVNTENEQLFRWLDGFNIPVILGDRSWNQSTAMMVQAGV